MATYFALPSLNLWRGSNEPGPGWSLSSGGSDAGSNPGVSDDIVFDGNSGSSRIIEVMYGASGRSWSITSGSSFTFNLYSGQSDQMFIGDGSSNNTVSFNGAHVVNVSLYLQGNSGYTTSFVAPLTTFKTIVQSGQAVTVTGNLNMTGYYEWNNSSFGSLQVSGSPTIRLRHTTLGPGNTLNLGSAIWEFTGNDGTNLIGGSGTVVRGTSTVKIVDASSAMKNLAPPTSLYNLVVEAGGTVTLSMSGHNLNSLTIKPAASATGLNAHIVQSHVINASNIVIDGTARPLNLRTNTQGSRATLNKTGGGNVYIDNCAVRDISGTTGTFKARNCVDEGNNLGITFVPANRGFLSFF